MISMRKNGELFFILEMLLLTPITLFWVGLASMFLTGSETIFTAVVGSPFSELRAAFVTLICPAAASWFAYEYIAENKKEKGPVPDLAKVIIAVCIATMAFVLLYLLSENVLLV